VHRAAEGERDELGEYEQQLRHEQSTAPAHPRSPARRARITFFQIALWLAAAGVLLTFLMPAAGVVCLVMAGLAGILAAVLGPGDANPDKYQGEA
jgi:fatty acid desaturase